MSPRVRATHSGEVWRNSWRPRGGTLAIGVRKKGPVFLEKSVLPPKTVKKPYFLDLCPPRPPPPAGPICCHKLLSPHYTSITNIRSGEPPWLCKTLGNQNRPDPVVHDCDEASASIPIVDDRSQSAVLSTAAASLEEQMTLASSSPTLPQSSTLPPQMCTQPPPPFVHSHELPDAIKREEHERLEITEVALEQQSRRKRPRPLGAVEVDLTGDTDEETISEQHIVPCSRNVESSRSDDDGDDDFSPPSTPAATLSDEQRFILEVATKHNRSIFLTGGAGTGKSFLLREIIQCLDRRTTYVTAPTGIAALNLGGTTIHSFAGIGKGEGDTKELFSMVKSNRIASTAWKNCRVLVIDEVSMLSAKLLNSLEFIARRVRGRDEPFGGIQLILCGDFLQLPPVTKRKTRREDDLPEADFCFTSRAWQKINPQIFLLRTIFRQQEDVQFATILNELRVANLSKESIHRLMSVSRQTRSVFVDLQTSLVKVEGQRERPMVPVFTDLEGATMDERFEGKTVLRSTNDTVQNLNSAKFSRLASPIFQYRAHDSGPLKHQLGQCPAESSVVLRVGARVMLLKNIDLASGLVNGTIGVVKSFVECTALDPVLLAPSSKIWMREIAENKPEQFPVVTFKVKKYSRARRKAEEVERDLVVQPQSWTITAGMTELACRWQIPLKLAWAITIHKSQGMTMSGVNVDFDRMFEDGQAYVALSRCTSLEGVTIENFDLRRVRANLSAIAFYDALEENLRKNGGDAAMFQHITEVTNPWGPTQEDTPGSSGSDSEKDDENTFVSKTEKKRKALCDNLSHERGLVDLTNILQRLEILKLSQHPAYFGKVFDDRLVEDPQSCTQVRARDLVCNIEEIEEMIVILDTCSLIALHSVDQRSVLMVNMLERNFTRIPQMVLVELDGITKRKDNDRVAFAAREARRLISCWVQDGLVAIQGPQESLTEEEVFPIGGAGTTNGTDSDRLTRLDNPIICYAAFLRKKYPTRRVVVCTEDSILGLRVRAAGLRCTSVNGRR